MTRHDRARELARRFREIYPDAHCELDFQNPLELLVATILSAQCTDKRVNIVTKSLFARCKRPRDYAQIPQDELEGSNPFNRILPQQGQKPPRDGIETRRRTRMAPCPRSLEALAALPGVGRKTANVVLGNAFGITKESSWIPTSPVFLPDSASTENSDPLENRAGSHEDVSASISGRCSATGSSGMAVAGALPASPTARTANCPTSVRPGQAPPKQACAKTA